MMFIKKESKFFPETCRVWTISTGRGVGHSPALPEIQINKRERDSQTGGGKRNVCFGQALGEVRQQISGRFCIRKVRYH